MSKAFAITAVNCGTGLLAMPQIRHSILVANVAFAEAIARQPRFVMMEGTLCPFPVDEAERENIVDVIPRSPEGLDAACLVGGSALILGGIAVALFGTRLASIHTPAVV